MKPFLLAVALLASPAYAATPAQVFEQITPTLQKYPDIKLVEICVPEGFCEIFTDFMWDRKGGTAETLLRPTGPGTQDDPGSVAAAVSDIVGSTAKAVGIGGRVKVEYEQTKKDGTKTTVKVEASFGVGAGAAAGASPSAADSK